jgi:transposase
VLSFDVCQATLDLYTELRGQALQRAIPNETDAIERALVGLKALAPGMGYQRVQVVAEPSGAYHDTLMRTARSLGLHTAWVSGEAVAKMRVVESNDTGKTDQKDPRVIHTLGRLGKTLTHRILPEPYNLLRQWARTYESAERGVVQAKGALHTQLKHLFADFSFGKDFLFGPSGQALVEGFAGNPHRIVQAGRESFEASLRKAAARIQRRSLERLFTEALSSVRHGVGEREAEVMEIRLQQIVEELRLHETRKEKARQAMLALYEQARGQDPHLPSETPGVVSGLHLARLVAETGPLSDFATHEKLLRFAGLNLRERASGKYRAKSRISKKGRARLRKVLGQVVLPLVKKNGLYGTCYHRMKEKGMAGNKAMTAVTRRFLRMLHGWYRSGAAFDRGRVFVCESQYKVAA